MRGQRSRTTSKAAGLFQARMIMESKLWWLSGFPFEGRWIVVPPGGERGVERLELSRQHLLRATYALTKLERELPRALSQLVGDVEPWTKGVRGLLSALKPWVHEGKRPCQDLLQGPFYPDKTLALARRIIEKHTVLKELVAALSWAIVTKPSSARIHLDWIAGSIEPLSKAMSALPPDEALAFGVQCCHLAASVGKKALAPLLRIMGCADVYRVSVRDGKAFASHAANAVRALNISNACAVEPPLALPLIELPRELLAWPGWLLTQDLTTRKRFLQLLDLCCPVPLVNRWANWWPEVICKVSRGRNIQKGYAGDIEKAAQLYKIRMELDDLGSNTPPSLDVHALTHGLEEAASPAFDMCFDAARRALGYIDTEKEPTLRAGFLVHWTLYSRAGNLAPGRLAALVKAFASHARQAGDEGSFLLPWKNAVLSEAARGRSSRCMVDDTLLDKEYDRRDIARFFEALAMLRQGHPEIRTDEIADRLVNLVDATHDSRLSASLAWLLYSNDEHHRWFSRAAFRAALDTAGSIEEDFVPAVRAFAQIEQTTELRADKLLKALLPVFGEDKDLMRLLLSPKDINLVIRCGRRLGVLGLLGRRFECSLEKKQRTEEWIEDYPRPLHDALLLLAGASDDAAAIARRITRAIFRDRQALQTELKAVDKLVGGATGLRRAVLEKRKASIRRRIEVSSRIPDNKIRKMRQKIRLRAARELLRSVETQAEGALLVAAAGFLGIPAAAAPDWLLSERVMRFFGPIVELGPLERDLGRTLLRIRCGPPPWDMRDHPANQRFIRSMKRKGIDMHPWLEGIGTEECSKGPGRILLALEDDPLEVFEMGWHFQTCLSPGNLYFFSVLSNAADINKRVLYGRDPFGNVVGRRLICLADDGGIVAFHSYCHEKGIDFDGLSFRFLDRLAMAMKTRLVGGGIVSRLVASDWYDDVPVDIARQYEFLKDRSSFRKKLMKIDLDELPALLTHETGSPELKGPVASMMLALPEVGSRPELVPVLLGCIGGSSRARLPGDASLRAALLLERIGEGASAARLFSDRIEEMLLQQHRTHRWMNFHALSFLARNRPGPTLNLLKRTRLRGVRSFKDEKEAERLVAWAICLQGLRRPRQALEVYRLASKANGPKEILELARDRVKQGIRWIDP